jgi:hypothetical protein
MGHVDDFWVCENCKSLNRPGAGRCYSCRAKAGSVPRMAQPATYQPAPQAAGASSSRQDFTLGTVPPAYLSRPVSPLSTAAAASAPGLLAGPEPRTFNPVTAVKRRVRRGLAHRPIVPTAFLGRLAAALIVAALAVGIALALTLMPALVSVLAGSDPLAAWKQVEPAGHPTAWGIAIALGVTGLAALLVFSLFMGLSTHNAGGLGADMPRLTPWTAGVGWGRAIWRQVEIALALIVPSVLVWLSLPIPGLIVALVFVEILQRHLDDPMSWLNAPARHVPDLYAKLGTKGSMSAPVAMAWSICYRLANLSAIALWLLPVALVIATAATAGLGKGVVAGWQAGSMGPAQAAAAALIGAVALFSILSALLLVPVTLGLSARQAARRALVRMGRSRDWAARPGQIGDDEGPAAGPTSRVWDPYDRIVEHFPRLQDDEDPAYADNTALGVRGGWGATTASSPGPLGSRGHEAFDQASLYSPSTTSSFPWSDEPLAPAD